MSTGQGNIQFQQKRSAPATITGAQNGLTIIGTNVELGGNLSHETTINLGTESIYFEDTNNLFRYIELARNVNRYTFGIIDQNTSLIQGYSAEPDSSIIYAGSLGEALKVQTSTKTYQFGDFLGANNGTSINLYDNTGECIITAGSRTINMNALSIAVSAGSNARLDVNQSFGEIQFSNNANNVKLRINNVLGFTGTVTPVNTITVNNGIVTNVA